MLYQNKVLLDTQETINFGKQFAGSVNNGGIILLHGDLGAGKTTFVQGLAQGLGIPKRIISPTFVIIRTYKLDNNSDLGNFYHIDLYRTETKQELEDLGLPEILANPHNIVVIEWAEKLGTLTPKQRFDINLEYINNDKRKVSFYNFNIND